MWEKSDIPTKTIKVYCPWTVALSPDVTEINVVWIAICDCCGEIVAWWSTEKKCPLKYNTLV